MKKLLSTKYSAGAFNAAILLLRLITGFLMMSHGYDLMIHFGSKHNSFMNFLGIGSTLSLALTIFAEFFCSLFIIMGLFTRFAAIPLIIAMSVALYKAHHGDIFGKGETSTLFLAGYIVLLFVGPGKISVDTIMGK